MTKIKRVLRSLPPHLRIWKSQLTSTFPISHRISGAFLACMLLFCPILFLQMGLISFTYANIYQITTPISLKFITSAVNLTALALSYHILDGVLLLFLVDGVFLLLNLSFWLSDLFSFKRIIKKRKDGKESSFRLFFFISLILYLI
nr:succinate dehydrogenase subunit 3 [Ceratophyllum demersum]